MSTFFSRRYMRGRPSLTERWIGAIILVLLVLIVLTFAATIGLLGNTVKHLAPVRGLQAMLNISDRPLFAVDPKSRQQPNLPYEKRVASAMLPQSLNGLRRIGIEASTPGDIQTAGSSEETWSAVAKTFNAMYVYQGRYLAAAEGQNDTPSPTSQPSPDLIATILDAGTPANASDLYASREPKTAKKLNLGCAGWQAADGQSAGFWAGRYYTELEKVGPSAPADIEQPARLIAAQQLVYSSPAEQPAPAIAETPARTAEPSAPSAGPSARFADTGDPQILTPSSTERYTDDLYKKINGREPAFRAFDFVELRVGQYLHAARRESFEVFIYDMAEPANALGIYNTERSGDVQPVDIGRGGYASGASLFFWKSKYYVYILGPAEADAAAAETARKIGSAVAATILDDNQPFWAEALLPESDRLPDTLGYQAQSGLGFDFINRLFSAKYRTDDLTYQMYILKAENPEAARALFDQFAEQTGKYDTILKREPTEGGVTLVADSLGVFSVAFCKGSYFGGVAECDSRELAEQKATAFRDSLPAD